MWLSGSMILMYSYTGNLRASLMNPSFTRPLDTVADVYESGYTCQISNQPCFPLEERAFLYQFQAPLQAGGVPVPVLFQRAGPLRRGGARGGSQPGGTPKGLRVR